MDRDLPKSFSYFLRGAQECEDPECLYWVAHCYISGEGRPSGSVSSVEETRLAYEYLLKAASMGHGPSHFYLATVYSQGLSYPSSSPSSSLNNIVDPDSPKFKQHLETAVSLEEGDAMLLKAQLLLNLIGEDSDSTDNVSRVFPHDPIAGLVLLQRARALAHGESILLLGSSYRYLLS